MCFSLKQTNIQINSSCSEMHSPAIRSLGFAAGDHYFFSAILSSGMKALSRRRFLLLCIREFLTE